MRPNVNTRSLKKLPVRVDRVQCADGDFLCKAKKALQALLLPTSFLLVGSGKIAVDAANKVKREAQEKLEEAVKQALLLGLLGFGLYFAWKKL